MRIDDRKVNGRITIDPEDIIGAWSIVVDESTAVWFEGVDKNHMPIELSAGVAGSYIETALKAYNPVEFMIFTKRESGDIVVLPRPVYTVDNAISKCSIDIGELITGMILEIALPSGSITVKESK